jgi:hypothetical protein
MTVSVVLYDAHGEPLLVKTDAVEIPDGFDPGEFQPGVRCSTCGCSDEAACGPSGCFWVAPALCSTCRPDLAEAWMMTPEMVRYVAAGGISP